MINWADCSLKISWADCSLKRADQSNCLVKPALAGALVILLAYKRQYLILSLKKYIADRIIEAQTKQFIVAITPNRKCVDAIQGGTAYYLFTQFHLYWWGQDGQDGALNGQIGTQNEQIGTRNGQVRAQIEWVWAQNVSF